jgi:hypothetical protein
MCLRPQVSGETPTPLSPLERADLNHWTTQVKVEVKVTLQLKVYRQSVLAPISLGFRPFRPRTGDFFN